MPSFDQLLRGEDSALWLSLTERRLLKFAVDTFGVPLSSFLLSGIGEEEETRVWLFSVTFDDNPSVCRHRQIWVEAEDLPDVSTSLPGRREPLVLMALLRLLLTGRRLPDVRLAYRQEDVLRLLGWGETAESLHALDVAVNRYVDLSYRWALSSEELSERNLNKFRGWTRFVKGCGYRELKDSDDGLMKRASNHVEFCTEFLNELINRSVFGIEWDKVREITRTVSPAIRLSAKK